MEIERLDFKEKEDLLRFIYTKYRKAQLQLELMDIYFNPYPQSENLIKEKVTPYSSNYLLKRIEKKRNYELLVAMINRIHRKVSTDSVLILKKEYLNKEDKFWWKDYYARSTYYRLKRKAVEEFFMYYDDTLICKRL